MTTRRMRPPASDRAGVGARLVVIHGDALGSGVDLLDKPVTIGRSRDCEMSIDHGSVSRLHCVVWAEAGRFRVRDLGSTNKTVVNGVEVESAELEDGDTLAIGEIVLKFLRRESMEDRYHQAMVELASVDMLTQLPNRRIWRDGLERALARARHGGALSLVFIDLDHFKRINDQFGHLAGDEVLRSVAQVIRDSIAPGWLAGRLGGEEFAVVLPDVGLEQAQAYAESLRRAIASHHIALTGGARAVTTSLGVVEWHPGLAGSAELMRAADAELFRAKSAGRNRVCARPRPYGGATPGA